MELCKRIRRFCRWIGVPASALALAAVACEAQPPAEENHPVSLVGTLRIVSLSPELTPLLVEFGLASQIVGADATSHGHSELTAAQNLGELDAVDATSIAALDPNLVFAVGAEHRPPFADALRRRGIPFYVFEPTTANGVIQSIHELGNIVDREGPARSAVHRLTREISEIATERDGKKRLQVVWILQRNPLTIVGNRGLLHELLELAGGEMALHQLEGETIEVTDAVLAAGEPDVILDSSAQSRHEPTPINVRTEALPSVIGEVPTMDLLGRIRIIHALLYPAQPP